MLNDSYIKSRHIIIENWVMRNTNLRGLPAEKLTHRIFMKYYGKCL